jgi:hypothetical protein
VCYLIVLDNETRDFGLDLFAGSLGVLGLGHERSISKEV